MKSLKQVYLLPAMLALLAIGTQSFAVDAPTVTATATFDDIQINWTESVGADGYNVEVDGVYAETVTQGNMFAQMDLVPGQEYCYSVVAYEFIAGLPEFSVASELACAVAGDPAPTETCIAIVTELGIPTNVSAFAQEGVAGVDWDPVEGANGYNIFLNGDYLTTVKGDTSVQVAHEAGNLYAVAAFNDDNTPAVYGLTSEAVAATTVDVVVVVEEQ